jgi:hypothetical protein
MTMHHRLLALIPALLLAAVPTGRAAAAPAAGPTGPASSSPRASSVSSASPAASASPASPAASAYAAGSATSATPAKPAGTRRVALPGSDGKPVPYTIEIPAAWQVHSSKNVPGVFLGPAEVSEPGDPRAIWVRESPTPLIDPYAVVASIKEQTAKDFSWSAPVLEVRELGGIRGVLVRMDSGSGDQARSTLVLKMPYRRASVDFMVSASRTEFDRRLPDYQRIILSVQPVTR